MPLQGCPGVEVLFGFSQALRATESGLLWCVDMAGSPVRKAGPLLDLVR